MWGKKIRIGLLAAVLGALCATVQANTTGGGIGESDTVEGLILPAEAVPLQLAYNDITLYPEPALPQSASPEAVPEPLRDLRWMRKSGPVRIALLLPLRSTALQPMAEAVRAGFFAAYEAERDRDIAITLVETGDGSNEIIADYNSVAASHDIVVGPLTRDAVNTLATSGLVSQPTIALAQQDEGIVLPPGMLVMGIALEDEARQVARWAHGETSAGKALIISTAASWRPRAARAFEQEWAALGGHSQLLQLNTVNHQFLDPNQLADLRKNIKEMRPALVFAALDAVQAKQVREAIGRQVPLFGTSQLSPWTRSFEKAEPDELLDQVEEQSIGLRAMNGVRLIDMPWQLQPEHSAVTAYARLPLAAGEKRDANIDRLYALGIDAYRVAKEIGAGYTSFEMNGVTGRLRVDLSGSASSFERRLLPAVYIDGSVKALAGRQ